ncbi:NUDIX domain-containing protein [Cobetia amphilecti]|uniref:NUDIX hydrolase n=1 Tax=Cobetia amphilecti TaxID=1055104 RepID=A0AAP4U0G9_9GAMM|nr:NUDIX hydrolase [Cobetia amphilecti]MDO6673108.1 NUDIX hydrolase [Cobetia amphilecti]
MAARWTPNVAVACVVERAGRYLIVEEDKGGPCTVFNQPAGHLEPHERIIDGVQREVREETAWRILLTGYLGLYVHVAEDGTHFHSHSFEAAALEHLCTPLDPDIVRTHWLSLEEIEQLEDMGRLRSPLVTRRIRDSQRGKRFPLDVLHD